jgi:hypothetical protein
LVRPGLSKEGHVAAACAVDALPFDKPAPLAWSTQFAMEHAVALGTSGVSSRRGALQHFRERARSLRGLSAKLRDLMPPSVKLAAGKAKLGFVLYLCILLRWADPSIVSRLALGMRIMGELDGPPIFRSAFPTADFLSTEDLLADADQCVSDLQQRGKPSSTPGQDQALFDLCKKDWDAGFASKPQTRAFFDKKYGRGKWRPLWAFPLYQLHNGKWRRIDDGSLTLQNLG